jgi:hypothetical protein
MGDLCTAVEIDMPLIDSDVSGRHKERHATNAAHEEMYSAWMLSDVPTVALILYIESSTTSTWTWVLVDFFSSIYVAYLNCSSCLITPCKLHVRTVVTLNSYLISKSTRLFFLFCSYCKQSIRFCSLASTIQQSHLDMVRSSTILSMPTN